MAKLNAPQMIKAWLGYVSTKEQQELIFRELKDALLKDTNNCIAWNTLLQFMYFYKKVNSDKTEHINSDVLFQVSVLCCQSIHARQFHSVDMIKYLAAMYHVIAHFIEKDMITEILKLRQYVVLNDHTKDELNDELSRHLLLIFKLFSNVGCTVQQKYKEQSSSENYLLMLEVIKDSLELATCNGPKYLDLVFKTVSSISLPVAGTKNYENCLTSLLDIQLDALDLPSKFDTIECTSLEADVLYCAYILLASTTVENCLRVDDFLKARYVVAKLENTCKLQKFWSSVGLRKCLTFLKLVLSAVLYPMGSINCDLKNILDMSNSLLKDIARLHKENNISVKVVSTTCSHLTTVLNKICLKWSKATPSNWNHDITVDILESLHRLLQKIANLLQCCPYFTCSLADGSDCVIKVDSQMSVKLQTIITTNIQLALANKMDGIHSLLPQAELTQQLMMAHVLDLKAGGCPKWENIWHTVGISSYNLGVSCYNNQHWLYAKKIFSELCMVYMVLEDYTGNNTKSSICLWTCFKCLITSYEKLKKFQGSFVGLVVALGALPHRHEDIFKLWFSIKLNLEDNNNLLVSTWWHMYQKNKPKLQVKYPTIDFENLDVCQTLTWELETYNSYRRSLDASVGKALMANLKGELAKTCKTAVHAKGLRAYLESVERCGDKEENVEAVQMSEKACVALRLNAALAGADNQCMLAEILFLQFKCQNRASYFKQMSEIANAPKIPTSVRELETSRGEVSSDLELANICSINVCTEAAMMQSLHTLVKMCKSIVVSNVLDRAHLLRLITILKNAALVYEVYGYDTCGLKAWALVYNLACTGEDKQTCLLALSNLVAQLEYNSDSPWIQSANELALSLTSIADTATQDCLVAYWLNASISCWHSGQYATGKSLLKQAMEILHEKGCIETSILHAHAKLVTSHYLNLQPSVCDTHDLGDETAYDAAVDAHRVISAVIKRGCNPTENHQAVKILLPITFWLSGICLQQASAKQIIKYLKNTFALFQMLSLSSRTAQVLGILAHVDLLCWSYDDCQIKINALTNILQIYKNSNTVFPIDTVTTEKTVNDTLRDDSCMLPLPKMLDSQIIDRSPTVLPNSSYQPFKLPDFVGHKQGCLCVYCHSVVIQSLALDMPYLQAQCSYLRLNSKQALDYFQNALKLGKRLDKKQFKLFSNTIDDVLMNTRFDQTVKCGKALKASLCLSQANGLLWHADFYAQCKKNEKSNTLREDLKTSIQGFTQVESRFIQEIIEQHFDSIFEQHSAIGETLQTKYTIVTVCNKANMTSVPATSNSKKESSFVTPLVHNKNVRQSLLKCLNATAKQEMENAWYDSKSMLKRARAVKLTLSDERSPISDENTNGKELCTPNKRPVLKTQKTKLILDECSSNKSGGNKNSNKQHTQVPKIKICPATRKKENKKKGNFNIYDEMIHSPLNCPDIRVNFVTKGSPLSTTPINSTTNRRKLPPANSDTSPTKNCVTLKDKYISGGSVAGALTKIQTKSEPHEARSKPEVNSAGPGTVAVSSNSDSSADDMFNRKKSVVSKHAHPKNKDQKENTFELDDVLAGRNLGNGQSKIKKELIFSPIECLWSNGQSGTLGGSLTDAHIGNSESHILAKSTSGATNKAVEKRNKIVDVQQVEVLSKVIKPRRKVLSPSSLVISNRVINPSTCSTRVQRDKFKAESTSLVVHDSEENLDPKKQSAKSRTVLSRTKLDSATSNSDSDEIFKCKKSSIVSAPVKSQKRVQVMHTDITAVNTNKTKLPVRSSRRQNMACVLVENDNPLTENNENSKYKRALRKKLPKSPFIL